MSLPVGLIVISSIGIITEPLERFFSISEENKNKNTDIQ